MEVVVLAQAQRKEIARLKPVQVSMYRISLNNVRGH